MLMAVWHLDGTQLSQICNILFENINIYNVLEKTFFASTWIEGKFLSVNLETLEQVPGFSNPHPGDKQSKKI